MLTVRLLRARWQLFLARFQRAIARLVLAASALVAVLAQTDNGWAAVFGKWGPLVSVLLVWIAAEIKRAPEPPAA